VGLERDAILAAIDRLPSRPETVVVLTLAGPEGQLTIRERSSEALEVVDVGVVPDAPASAPVRLARLRKACDTASPRMELHLSSRCVMTRDELLVNRAGRRVLRESEGTVHVETYRVVATMEKKNPRTEALRDQATTENISRGSTP
jgi:hypothetical protein